MADRVNWEYVSELIDKYGKGILFNCFAPTDGVDPRHSAVVMDDVDIQPPWNVRKKIGVVTAITGGMLDKRHNPNQPITPEEIYQSAREACLAGTPGLHIHVRDEEGNSVLDYDLFHKVIDPIKEEFPDVVIDGCLVCGRTPQDWDVMNQILKEHLFESTPVNAFASYNGDELLCAPPHVMIDKCKTVQDFGVIPQVTFYSSGDINNATRYLIRSGLLKKPYNFGLLYGLVGCSPMDDPRAMMETMLLTHHQLLALDPDCRITVNAAGRASSWLVAQCLMMGLNVRVGMEDTVWKYPHSNEMITSNAEQFKACKQMASLLGLEIMTAKEYREYLGLPQVTKK